MQIEKALKGVPGHEDEVWSGEGKLPDFSYEPFDHSILLQDREFRNILTLLWIIQDTVQASLKELETELSDTMPLIQNEIRD